MIKFIKKALLIGILVSSIATLGTLDAKASNTRDTTFGFRFGLGFGNTDVTGYREKQDRSSVYKKITYWDNNGEYTAWIQTENGTRESPIRHYFRSDNGKTFYLSNYVYENHGKTRCAIKAKKASNFSAFNVNGIWSPDSI